MNILCVRESVKNFFMDHDLGCHQAVSELDLSKGMNFFQNCWFAWMFIERAENQHNHPKHFPYHGQEGNIGQMS